jgi:S-adenosylmethionine-diacylglycerol 3-amino-3-carboxypropyl transferase
VSAPGELPAWVERVAEMPIAFAQVREDALLDAYLCAWSGREKQRWMMIASGGCTAALLAAAGRFGELHLVDVNPAQMALCRLKLWLLQHATPAERRRLLGHAPMPGGRWKKICEIFQKLSLPAEILGPADVIDRLGPDRAGRYELLFAQLRLESGISRLRWAQLLLERDVRARIAAVAPGAPMGRALDAAFDDVFALPNLIRLFGAAATQNSAIPFARHFAERTRHAIATLPTATNPYLWQLLVGSFLPGSSYPWLDADPPPRMPEVVEIIGPFDAALATMRGELDGVHLSNILDWLTADQARQTLELAHRALRPGGMAWIRQLNSTLDPRSLGSEFRWHTEESTALHARDRSFFYRRLHLGTKS